MVESDPEIMRGAPVYKGTRIPVQAVADILSQGASVGEILEGYPALTREKIELAPIYVKAFPQRGRPARRLWAARGPRRVSEQRLSRSAANTAGHEALGRRFHGERAISGQGAASALRAATNA